MKRTRLRSIVIYILSIAFIGGLVLFVVKIFANGNIWATNAINSHIAEEGSLSMAGRVLDRNGNILAQTVDGERIYNSDYTTRVATLHTVGDNTKFISTAVQNSYRADLIGYNFITGLTTAGIFGYGNNIRLTISSSLCSQAYNLFEGRKGAAVVYNYITGEILCMTSSPSYDPQNPISVKDTEGNDEYEGVYLNKCLSSSFTPGSIFKVVTCAAAINNIDNIYNKKFHCDGSLKIGDEELTCHAVHGDISFKEAMSQSCNVAFARIAQLLGKEKLTKQAEEMGFNKTLTVDEINLAQSIYNVSDAKELQFAWSASGQYDDLVNPMHMAIIMGAIANSGVPVEPYVIENIESPIKYCTHVGYAKPMQRLLSADTADKLKSIMRYTVKTNYGDYLFGNLKVCAKTGTAEVGNTKSPNGWMVGFSVDEDCPLAFAVVVENSNYGISTAGPIAEALMQSAAQMIRE